MRLEVLVVRTHLPEFGAKFLEYFLEGSDVDRGRSFLVRLGQIFIGRSRSSTRSSVGKSRRKGVAYTELINFVGKIGQKLVGGKTVGRSGMLTDRFRLTLERHDGNFRRLLIVRRDQRLGVENELVVLIQLKFRLFDLRGMWNCGCGWLLREVLLHCRRLRHPVDRRFLGR